MILLISITGCASNTVYKTVQPDCARPAKPNLITDIDKSFSEKTYRQIHYNTTELLDYYEAAEEALDCFTGEKKP